MKIFPKLAQLNILFSSPKRIPKLVFIFVPKMAHKLNLSFFKRVQNQNSVLQKMASKSRHNPYSLLTSVYPRLPPGAPYWLSAGRELPYPGRSSSSSPGSTSTSPGSAVTRAPGLLPSPDPGLLPPAPPEGGRGVREGAGKEFEAGLDAPPPSNVK